MMMIILTPWSRVVLEKLTVNFAASQEIPRIYGTRNSLTVPTSARHLSLCYLRFYTCRLYKLTVSHQAQFTVH
jgi:hypothetical protein